MTDMRTRFVETATTLLDEDSAAVVLLADISDDRFEEAARRHPDRFLNLGIREALLVGAGSGLALTGMRPILHSYAPFLVERAFEQIKLDFRHQEARAVLVGIGASYDRAEFGRTHHAPGDVALLDTLPDWQVHVPGHPEEAAALLRKAHRSELPGYLRLSTSTNAEAVPAVVDGRLHSLREGRQALVLAVGPMLDRVLRATRDLDVAVAYASTVRPLDLEGLRTLTRGDTVIVVEPYLAGTSARLVDLALADRPHRTVALGVERTELRRYGTSEEHDAAYGLDIAGLRRSITAAVRPAAPAGP